MARRARAGANGNNDQDVNLTPMLDVVFILLIFFIVTAQFIKEPGVDINRTDVETDAFVKPLAILVAIDAESDIYIDKRKIDPNEVEFTLKELRKDNPKGEIVVQADNKSRAEVLIGLLETIKSADAATVVNVST
ncbi:MAG: biopolymer transporter ExbD, partial [Pseudomonadota bacterium]